LDYRGAEGGGIIRIMAGVVANILRWFSGRARAQEGPADSLVESPPRSASMVAEPRPEPAAAKLDAVPPIADREEASPPIATLAPAEVTPAQVTPARVTLLKVKPVEVEPTPDQSTPVASPVQTSPVPPASNGNGAPVVVDAEEIKRRRELVRSLFNDFWSDSDEKPAAFVDRLDQAEAYLNERLSASGEPWQIDANTRKVLGLPARSNGRGRSSAAARR
jgi:hypothetical protein